MLPLCDTLAGPCSPLATHLQGHVTLMPHTCRAVFPSCPHTCRAMFPSCHTCAGPCSPLAHTLAGPCSPRATHRVTLMPHTCRAVFPYATHTGRTVFPPYATHSQGRVPPMLNVHRSAVLYAIHSQGRVSFYTTQSQGQAAQLPEQGEAFIYSPLLVPVSGSGFHSARQLTNLKRGVLMG